MNAVEAPEGAPTQSARRLDSADSTPTPRQIEGAIALALRDHPEHDAFVAENLQTVEFTDAFAAAVIWVTIAVHDEVCSETTREAYAIAEQLEQYGLMHGRSVVDVAFLGDETSFMLAVTAPIESLVVHLVEADRRARLRRELVRGVERLEAGSRPEDVLALLVAVGQ